MSDSVLDDDALIYIDPGFVNGLSLQTACKKNDYESARNYLRQGANPNVTFTVKEPDGTEYNITALLFAVGHNNSQMIRMLLAAGAQANPNGRGLKPLSLVHWSEIQDVSEWFEELVSKTTNLNEINDTKPTYLMQAARDAKNPDVLRVLIQHGADVNLCDQGVMPIDAAMRNDNTEIFNFLWNNIDKDSFKTHVSNVESYLLDMLRAGCYEPHKVSCFYRVMDLLGDFDYSGRFLYEIALREYLVHDTAPEDMNPVEYAERAKQIWFGYRVHSEKFSSYDLCELVLKLNEKGAHFNHEKELEGLVYLCHSYNLNKLFDKSALLTVLLADMNVNFNNAHIANFVVGNHPIYLPLLYEYSIIYDPIDYFKIVTYVKRSDVEFLILIILLLKECTPSRQLRQACIDNLKNIYPYSSYRYFGTYTDIYEPLYHCIPFTSISREEDEKREELFQQVLDMLQTERVPTLIELSRKKVRELIRPNCDTTYDYCIALKYLNVPARIKYIIRSMYLSYYANCRANESPFATELSSVDILSSFSLFDEARNGRASPYRSSDTQNGILTEDEEAVPFLLERERQPYRNTHISSQRQSITQNNTYLNLPSANNSLPIEYQNNGSNTSLFKNIIILLLIIIVIVCILKYYNYL